MSKPNIGIIVGSNSQSSINMQLAKALTKLVSDQANFEIIDITKLPFYNRDEDDNTPKAFVDFKALIGSKDGILFVTPEHNRSVPALLKNALDGGSRPFKQGAWNGIPAGVIGTSPGGPATSMAQQHLRNILVFLDMPTMQQPEGFIQWKDGLVDANGNIGTASHDYLNTWMQKFLAWVEKHPRQKQ
ncbi:NADPH-dependent FMN reductase [Diaphorobacter aerolatus]|uniref:NAD(P)H-dependent oxidoreductase n=1 Tax=Diaphorobacter aerolatus TaxID=1288495 RepID=A0A7H0GJ06_9BURK|nr:NADPH-dependent FMN reductase [Diaphorobacter aerolatus]QNP48272.1 NAD(P)H-dependent oxidoreductase [Diaphorobacter aerolatus]